MASFLVGVKYRHQLIGQAGFCQSGKDYGVVMEGKAHGKGRGVYYLRTLKVKEVIRAPRTKHQ
ncbi:MAG: hypothetical protein DRP64_01105 [Verrucomicrobia bacterium]|nr:MAG: hypothetical protein DRP64_01105 [Verrucomicrobiota bacterium]